MGGKSQKDRINKVLNREDLENLWGAIQTDLRQNTDFDEIFIKYLENDNVDRKTWLGAP